MSGIPKRSNGSSRLMFQTFLNILVLSSLILLWFLEVLEGFESSGRLAGTKNNQFSSNSGFMVPSYDKKTKKVND